MKRARKMHVAIHFDSEDKQIRVAGVYSSYQRAENRIKQLDGGWIQSLVLNAPVKFTFEPMRAEKGRLNKER